MHFGPGRALLPWRSSEQRGLLHGDVCVSIETANAGHGSGSHDFPSPHAESYAGVAIMVLKVSNAETTQ